MNRFWLKLLIFLIPAIGGAIYLVWRFSPEQVLIRRAAVVFECVEKGTLSAGTPKEKAQQFQDLLTEDFELMAPRPLPSGPLPPAQAARSLLNFQQSVLSCRVTRDGETVAFPSEGHAIYQSTLEADVAVTPSNRRVMRYRCRFEFVKAEEEWLLRLIVLTPI